MNWIILRSPDQLEALRAESNDQPVIIFKHSTRCSISHATLGRLERNWKEEDMISVKSYFLDLLSYRDISNQISEQFDIEHQSPQVIILKDGEAVYNKSHFDIDFIGIRNAANGIL